MWGTRGSDLGPRRDLLLEEFTFGFASVESTRTLGPRRQISHSVTTYAMPTVLPLAVNGDRPLNRRCRLLQRQALLRAARTAGVKRQREVAVAVGSGGVGLDCDAGENRDDGAALVGTAERVVAGGDGDILRDDGSRSHGRIAHHRERDIR